MRVGNNISSNPALSNMGQLHGKSLVEQGMKQIGKLVENNVHQQAGRYGNDVYVAGKKVKSLLRMPHGEDGRNVDFEITSLEQYLSFMKSKDFDLQRAIKFGMDPDAAQKMLEKGEGFDEKFAIEHGMNSDAAHEMSIYGMLNHDLSPKDEGAYYSWADRAESYFHMQKVGMAAIISYGNSVKAKIDAIDEVKNQIEELYSSNKQAEEEFGSKEEWLKRVNEAYSTNFKNGLFDAVQSAASQVRSAQEWSHGLGAFLSKNYLDEISIEELGLPEVCDSKEGIIAALDGLEEKIRPYMEKLDRLYSVATKGGLLDSVKSASPVEFDNRGFKAMLVQRTMRRI